MKFISVLTGYGRGRRVGAGGKTPFLYSVYSCILRCRRRGLSIQLCNRTVKNTCVFKTCTQSTTTCLEIQMQDQKISWFPASSLFLIFFAPGIAGQWTNLSRCARTKLKVTSEIIQRDEYNAKVRIHVALYTLDIHAFLACHLGMKVIAVWRFFAQNLNLSLTCVHFVCGRIEGSWSDTGRGF
jgi:hypothetical protein